MNLNLLTTTRKENLKLNLIKVWKKITTNKLSHARKTVYCFSGKKKQKMTLEVLASRDLINLLGALIFRIERRLLASEKADSDYNV